MKLKTFAVLALIGSAVSCAKQLPFPALDTTPYELEFGALPNPGIPADNPMTEQGVKLGRMLFYETRLSGDNTMSCASCHRQEHAFSDTSRFSVGIHGLPGKRQAMSTVNMLWNLNTYFWDGRAPLLRDQSLMPIEDELEMAETLDRAIKKLAADTMYTHQFLRAFGTHQPTEHLVSLALEQFMHSIVSHRSKYDKYLAGEAVLTEEEERGRELFFTEYNPFFPDDSGADCAHCHSGKNFDSPTFHNNGTDSLNTDMGLYNVTGDPKDIGLMKTVTLRNIALTPPYMHDGRFSTLEEVVRHYNTGIQSSPTLDAALESTLETGLRLTQQDISDLTAFLHTLTDEELLLDQRYSSPF